MEVQREKYNFVVQLLVYVVHKKPTDWPFSRLSRAKTEKKFTQKKRDVCAKLFFAY